VATSVQTMPVSAQMGQTSDPPGEGQVLAHIRRLRGEIASIFTNRTRNSYKCRNRECPSNKEPDKIGVSDISIVSDIPGISDISCEKEKVSTSLVAAKKSLTRRKSCPAGPSQGNIVTSRQTWTKSQVPTYHTNHPTTHQPRHNLPTQPPPHRQLCRRHSDMPGRRQEESWQRRPRETFLNTESVDDDHEEYNEVARYMWRHNMERRRKAQSFRYPRFGLEQADFSSVTDSNYSVEEHIYEEIAEAYKDDDDTEEEDAVDNSLITLISSRRRNNLRYYGHTSWDFGTEVI